MSEMIERVAKAIHDAAEPKIAWERRSAEYKLDYLDYARAAIQAMREDLYAFLSYDEEGVIDMIDAALKEEGE